MRKSKNIIRGWRVNIAFLGLLFLGLGVLWNIWQLNGPAGKPYLTQATQSNRKFFEIPANRGDLYDCNMNLLATSVPLYELRIDFGVDAMHDTSFYRSLDLLAQGLAQLFPKKSRMEWKKDLLFAKRSKPVKRFWLLQKEVSYGMLVRARALPLMGLQGASKQIGGLIAIQTNRRVLPFGNLAARTIGYIQQGKPRVGLEAGLDSVLMGETGLVLKQRMGGGVWKPVDQDLQKEPLHGRPVVTTLDIRLQEIAHQALFQAMNEQKAMKGCAILMEMQTGKIRAMTNMVRKSSNADDSGQVGEFDQVAYGIGVEPGSVFKLVTLMAGLSDGYWTLEDSIPMTDYVFQVGKYKLEDEHRYGPWMTIEEIFAKSSNVGTTRLLHRYYGNRPEAFFAKLKDFGLAQSMNLPLLQDPKPKFRTTALQDYSPSDLYSTGIGYSMSITPLQMLTFYNAVVNEGIRVDPSILEDFGVGQIMGTSLSSGLIQGRNQNIDWDIREPSHGSTSTLPAGRRILDRQKAQAARRMMRRVAIDGTVKEQMKGLTFGIGGKTGTARLRDGSGISMNHRHRAMFIGYFPEPNPKYSCLVMLEDPRSGLYYASQVAAPVFRDIAELTMATREFQQIPSKDNATGPVIASQSIQKVQAHHWGKCNVQEIHDLVGMDGAAAVWALESKGYRVSVQGRGKVRQCTGLAGTSFADLGGIPDAKPGQRVMLSLGI